MSEVPCTKSCRGHCLRVSRAGVTYRCAKAMAHAFGVQSAAVYQALHRHGNAERVGGKRGGAGNHKKPVQVGPHKWPSISAMALALGVDRTMLGKKLRREPEAVLSLVMQWEHRKCLERT